MISSFKTNSSFDCFSECIKDQKCKRFTRTHPNMLAGDNTCFKKNSVQLITGNIPDAQYGIIKSN